MAAFEEGSARTATPGRLIIALFFVLFGAGGLVLLPFMTRTSPGDEGWYTQPWLMPTLTLALLTVCAVAHTIRILDRRAQSTGTVGGELWMWLRAAEFFLWYVAYILLLGWVGYGLSTLLFIAGLSIRVGLRRPRWLLAALGVTIAMTLLFRLGLKIWVPAADLYDLMPKDVRNFLQRYF